MIRGGSWCSTVTAARTAGLPRSDEGAGEGGQDSTTILGGRLATRLTATPNLSISTYPRPEATASAGVRSWTVITTASGQCLLTRADWTCVIPSSRRATAAVLIRTRGVPSLTSATWSTSAVGTRWFPVTVTDRTTSRLEPSSA